MGFMVFGVEMLFGLVPFKTSPLFALVFVVLSFFLLGCSPATFLSLSFSFSGAGETQTPFGVWVSPCVLFLPDALYVLDPYALLRLYIEASLQLLCVFFFLVGARVGCVLVLVSLSCPGWVGGGGPCVSLQKIF